jgi:hypothetical protein
VTQLIEVFNAVASKIKKISKGVKTNEKDN